MTCVFYLGTHQPQWLGRYFDVPMFLSRRTLAARARTPMAFSSWVLDSGGYSELSKFGRWEVSKQRYSSEILRWQDKIGSLVWAAPMDWMCEPSVLEKTGRTVRDHQHLTLENFLWLREKVGVVVAPVLQGWVYEDYLQHVRDYEEAGVSLSSEKIVGVGSICRRGQDQEIIKIARGVADLGIAVHAFGVRSKALEELAPYIASADSMAWSYQARRRKILLPGCVGHENCANCPRWAMMWYQNTLDRIGQTAEGNAL